MKPLRKHEITWRHRDTAEVGTVVYFTSVHDRDATLADVRNAELDSTEQDALVAYRRACEAGEAQFMAHATEDAE